MRTVLWFCAVLAWNAFPFPTIVRADVNPKVPTPTGTLTLHDAVEAALGSNPELTAVALEVRAREARRLQAGLLPNPELFVEVENVGGSGERRDFDAAETTYGISQLIELGGKRPKRRRLADLEQELANRDHDATRRGVVARTSRAFMATLVAQRRLSLLRDLEAIAATSVRSAEARHRAGATPAVASRRAALALSRARVQLVRAERDLAAKRRALAASWGGASATFTTVDGNLTSIAPPPPLAELERRLADSPVVARWTTEIERQRVTTDLERAQRIPDPTLGVGGRHFSAEDDDAIVFQVSVPLPLFDRNQGRMLAAEHAAAKARAERAAAMLALRSELAGHHETLAATFEEARILEEQTLPAAGAAFEETRRAYEKGLLHSLDVLDAQRTLSTVREQHLDTLAAHHEARLEIERLTATEIGR